MFEITILQETLATVLDYLSPTVGNNSNALGDNLLSMASTDVGSCVFYTTNTIESTIIEAVCSNATKKATANYVDFKRFKGIISSIGPKEFITIKETTSEILISFSMRKTPIKLASVSTGMLPYPNIYTAPSVPEITEMETDFFAKVVRKASSIITDSNTAQLMNCIHFQIGNPDVLAEALDFNGKRTFKMTSNFGTSVMPFDFMIEASKMAKSLKLFSTFKDIEIAKDNAMTWIRGYTQAPGHNQNILQVHYFLRQYSGTFPNISQYFSQQYYPTEFISVNRKDMLDSIARIKVLGSGDSASITSGIHINATKNEFTIHFGSQYGTLEDPIGVLSGIQTPFSTALNPSQFEGLLKVIDAEYIDIGVMQNVRGTFLVKGSTSSYQDTDVFSILGLASNSTTQAP